MSSATRNAGDEPVTRPPESAPTSTAAGSHRLLSQIQAMRALAVLLVVLYHLWPKRLTGGYVGVDVFFVISGFLMTRHLLARSAQGVPLRRALNDFYLRRIRRIAPASFVVLAVITVVTLTLVSRVHWVKFLGETVASALYVENWALAAKSTDYLAADTGASPVQHFWSLSVEEQFYVVWPLAVLLAGLAVVRQRRVGQLALLVVVFGGSLAYSVWALTRNPAAAYFDTGARLWEFAVGGVLAFGFDRVRTGRWQAAALAWIGLALVAYSALTYTGDTKFPGPAALVPCVGTALVIASGDRSSWFGPHAIFRWRPVQFVGDISYSVYLWHWPLIALWPDVVGRKLDFASRVGVLVAALVLGWLSKVLVEDRFRGQPRAGRRSRTRDRRSARTYAGLVAAMVVVVALAGSELVSTSREQDQAQTRLDDVLRTPPSCYGAESVSGSQPGCTPGTVTLRRLTPSPLIATSGFEDSACQQRATRSSLKTCHFGSTSPNAPRLALAGDSHATQWLPALAGLAQRNGWNLTTYLMSGCAVSADGVGAQCRAWNTALARTLAADDYDAVVVGARSATGDASATAVAKGLASAWRTLQDRGVKVIALRDVPQPVDGGVGDVPSCVYDSSPSRCTFARGPALARDVVHRAVSLAPGVRMVDLTRLFCSTTRCHSVVGNVLVYLDDNHITPLFSISAADALSSGLASSGLPVATG